MTKREGVSDVLTERKKGYALGRGSKVGIVGSASVLNTDLDTIASSPSLSDVVDLKVERLLGESVSVGNVVKRVDDEERVGDHSQDVGLCIGLLGVVVLRVQDEYGGGLSDEALATELDDIVASRRRLLSTSPPEGVPTEGQCLEVLGVGEGFEAVAEVDLSHGRRVYWAWATETRSPVWAST